MPPKGWRKNAEGQYPTPNKDTELVSIDDILFPKSTIQKLAKGILNDEEAGGSNMIIAKDSLLALQRSATVFVSHVLFHARQASHKASRKTVNAQDIFQALEDAEFSGFIPEVKQSLSIYENAQSLKKRQKIETKTTESSTESKNNKDGPAAADEEDEEDADEGDAEDEAEEDGANDVEEPEADEVEEVAVNPIAASEQEQAELEGTTELEQVEDDKEDGSDSDDE